jgi:O-methyltransferase involved in polyketide biosynthesis
VLCDPHAERLFRELDYDFSHVRRSAVTCCGLAVRARVLDDWTREFLSTAEAPRVVTLGCGLDDRSRRVGRPAAWLDVDLPVVEPTWRATCSDSGRAFTTGSLDDEAWLDALPEGHDTRIIIEGVLMYVAPERVARVFRLLRGRLPRAEVWADVLSPLASRTAALHPAVARTGNSFLSGWKTGASIEGYELVEELSLYRPHPERWGRWRILGHLPVVRGSWRLLRLRPRE